MKNLSQPHMSQLVEFVKRLRKRYPDGYVPDFDPDDGGVDAEILFLFEKPGRKTDPSLGGSGFISQDNNDQSAEATKRFLIEAGINRKKIVIWNTISAWNGTTKITAKESQHSVEEFQELLTILKKIRCVVLVGLKAQKIEEKVDLGKYQVVRSYHPSPKVKASNPDLWSSIPNTWRQAVTLQEQEINDVKLHDPPIGLSLTIDQAKVGLSNNYGVPKENIEIILRG